MIDQSVLDQIQDRIDIVEVVSKYIPLTKTGRGFKSPCPFHTEKTPSFNVSAEKQIFHCFGCGVGGNVFSFVMKYEKLSFPETVSMLAERAGVLIPKDDSSQKNDKVTKVLYEINELAAKFYSSSYKSASENSGVKKYIKDRNLSEDALLKFHIGYSPSGWNHFLNHAARLFEPNQLVDAGLAIKRDDGGAYDRFRGRLMFPIKDPKGRVIGFGARVLDKTLPKYINSPETIAYRKSHVLYGFFEAKEEIRQKDCVILVEGYMDVIACYQAGIQNVVASSGTALTSDQARLIKRHTRQVIVLFDADQAGQNATLRGLDILVEEGCSVKVATLPKGDDPDTYITKNGSPKFLEEIIGQSKSLFDYKFGVLMRQVDIKQIDGKVKLAGEMLATIRRLPNEIEKNSMIRELSNRLGVGEDSLLAELNKKKAGTMINQRVVRVTQQPVKKSSLIFEKTVIGLMISQSVIWEKYKSQISVEDFTDPNAKSVLEVLLKASEWDQIQLSKILNQLQDNERSSFLVRQAVHEMENIANVERAMEDCLKQVKKGKEDVQMSLLRAKIAESERSHDKESLNRLLQEFAEFSKRGR